MTDDNSFPAKRLIVFAGTLPGARSVALYRRKAEAIMVSHESVRKGSWWEREKRKHFDHWPQYRYLDSGVFTLMRQAGISRVSANTQPKQQRLATLKKRMPVQVLRQERKRVVVPQAIIHDRFIAYRDYLKAHLDEWDFALNFDIEQMDIERGDGKVVSGLMVAERMTEQLYEICGPKLIVVWHPARMSWDYWKTLVAKYKYLAIGSDAKLRNRELKYACDYAHTHGRLVHGLAVGTKVLGRVPFDTADCSTWISGIVYGIFAGINYGLRYKKNSYDSRHAWLEQFTRELGIDPAVLATPDTTGPNAVAKFEIAIALFQRKQALLNPVATPHEPARLPITYTI